MQYESERIYEKFLSIPNQGGGEGQKPFMGYIGFPNGSMACMYGHHIQQSMDQPGKVANPACGQLNREN